MYVSLSLSTYIYISLSLYLSIYINVYIEGILQMRELIFRVTRELRSGGGLLLFCGQELYCRQDRLWRLPVKATGGDDHRNREQFQPSQVSSQYCSYKDIREPATGGKSAAHQWGLKLSNWNLRVASIHERKMIATGGNVGVFTSLPTHLVRKCIWVAREVGFVIIIP